MPQAPPLAVRFKASTLEAIDRYAAKNDLKRNRAITALVEAGLDASEGRVKPAAVFHGGTVPVTPQLTPAQQMSEREARDAFWRKTGAFNPKGKTK